MNRDVGVCWRFLYVAQAARLWSKRFAVVWCSNFGHRQFDPAMLHFLERVGVKARLVFRDCDHEAVTAA